MATTKGPRVLRLPRNNEEGFVLVRVSSKGRDHRDLKLIGTEGEHVFSTSMKHSQILKLNRSSAINQAQWDELLLAILFGEDEGNVTEDIEAIASVDDSSMTIIIQKKIEGITSKYGEISLPVTEDEEVSVFDWCGLTAQSRDESRDELQHLRSLLQKKSAQVKKLEAANTELVQLKTENETQLLEKFSLLLNEKKLKIRDQQRLLASSNVDPSKVEAIEDSRTAIRSRSAGPFRKGKRKATEPKSDDEDSDAGFEKMDVDEAAQDSEQEDVRTQSESEDDDSEPVLPPPRKQTTKQASAEPVLPPKRDLPFKEKAKQQVQARPPKEGSETESGEDDEL